MGTAANWIQLYLCTAREIQEVLILDNYSFFNSELTQILGVYNKVATAKQELEKL